MKAIVQDRYGTADVLELRDIDPPRSATTRCSSGSAPPLEYVPASAFSSSAPAWAPSPSSSPWRPAPRSPASAAPPNATWSGRSARTTSSTTPGRTSPTGVSGYDTAGNRTLSHLRRALTPKGTLVLVGGEAADGRWLQGFDRQLRALLLAPLVGQRLIPLVARESTENLDALTALIDAGRLRPVIDRTWPLARAADAIRHVERGHARGKNVILP